MHRGIERKEDWKSGSDDRCCHHGDDVGRRRRPPSPPASKTRTSRWSWHRILHRFFLHPEQCGTAARLQALEERIDSNAERVMADRTRLSTMEQSYNSASWPFDNGRPTFASGDGRFTMSIRTRFQTDFAGFMQDDSNPAGFRRSGRSLQRRHHAPGLFRHRRPCLSRLRLLCAPEFRRLNGGFERHRRAGRRRRRHCQPDVRFLCRHSELAFLGRRAGALDGL